MHTQTADHMCSHAWQAGPDTFQQRCHVPPRRVFGNMKQLVWSRAAASAVLQIYTTPCLVVRHHQVLLLHQQLVCGCCRSQLLSGVSLNVALGLHMSSRACCLQCKGMLIDLEPRQAFCTVSSVAVYVYALKQTSSTQGSPQHAQRNTCYISAVISLITFPHE